MRKLPIVLAILFALLSVGGLFGVVAVRSNSYKAQDYIETLPAYSQVESPSDKVSKAQTEVVSDSVPVATQTPTVTPTITTDSGGYYGPQPVQETAIDCTVNGTTYHVYPSTCNTMMLNESKNNQPSYTGVTLQPMPSLQYSSFGPQCNSQNTSGCTAEELKKMKSGITQGF